MKCRSLFSGGTKKNIINLSFDSREWQRLISITKHRLIKCVCCHGFISGGLGRQDQ